MRTLLIVELHGRIGARIQTGGGRFSPPGRHRFAPTDTPLSSNWVDRTPSPAEVDHWLRALLPQGGAGSLHWTLARKRFEHEGVAREPADAADAIWGLPGREYAGAVTFRSHLDDRPIPPPPDRSGPTLAERDIGDLIAQATRIARRAEATSDDWTELALPASSGTLPKIALHRDPATDQWHRPGPERPSTHILKHENRADLPGEAAAEAVCQRALASVGLRAAPTRALVISGFQLVASERSDREHDPDTGTIRRRHQEEWVQAASLDPTRLAQQPGENHGWRSIAARLREQSVDPDAELHHLTRVMAAAALLAHRDCHRRNIGLRHAPHDAPFSVELAPLYDFSTATGQHGDYGARLPLPIEGEADPDRIRPQHWRTWAEANALDPNRTASDLLELCHQLPDALADEMARRRNHDEVTEPEPARRRLAAVLEETTTRCRNLAGSLRASTLQRRQPASRSTTRAINATVPDTPNAREPEGPSR